MKYYLKKKKEGFSNSRAFIITMIHFLARFQQEPGVSPVYQKITGKKPTTLSGFIEREKDHFWVSEFCE